MAEEKNFEKRLKNYLHSIGVYPAGFPLDKMSVPVKGWYTKIWGGGFQKSGIPDMLCCINGFMVAIETKGTDGRASELQKLNVSRINKSGGIAVILYPQGFKQFKELLTGVMCCNSHIQELDVLKSANSSTKCNIWTG